MNSPIAHRHADDHKPPSSAPRARAYPPHSLLGVGVAVRLSVATLATALLWVTVWWALK